MVSARLKKAYYKLGKRAKAGGLRSRRSRSGCPTSWLKAYKAVFGPALKDRQRADALYDFFCVIRIDCDAMVGGCIPRAALGK